MESTKNTIALILNRQAYREGDSLVTVYTRDYGKLSLVARGTKKPQSKLAGHIEPLTLAEIMIIGGKGRDYIGSAVMNRSYQGLRSDLNKLYYAGQGINLFRRLVKENQADERLFFLLADWLDALDGFTGDSLAQEKTELAKEAGELFLAFFILKLFAEMGYQPEMSKCLICGQIVKPGKNWFNPQGGGLVCEACFEKSKNNAKELINPYLLTISDNCVKIVRFIIENDFSLIKKLRVDKKVLKELSSLLNNFKNFHSNI